MKSKTTLFKTIASTIAVIGLVSCGNSPEKSSSESTSQNEGKLISLQASLTGVQTKTDRGVPGGPNIQPATFATLNYFIPCWSRLEEGYPKTNIVKDQTTGNYVIEFNGLARDYRMPASAVCRGLNSRSLEVLVGPGFISEEKVSLINLEISEEIEDSEEVENFEAKDKLITLKAYLDDVFTKAGPGESGGPSSQPATFAKISYYVPCWSKMKEGYPRHNIIQNISTGEYLIEFIAVAQDTRLPNSASCRGLISKSIELLVGPGVIEKEKVQVVSLELSEIIK